MEATNLKHAVAIDPEKALAELKWLGLAVATDTTRYAISHVHVDGKRTVATDGYRLHYIEETCLPAGFSVRGSEIVRLVDLARDYSLQAVELHAGYTYWRFESADGSCELKFHISAVEYPAYERVLPKPADILAMPAAGLRKVFIQPNGDERCVIGKGHFIARYIADALRSIVLHQRAEAGHGSASRGQGSAGRDPLRQPLRARDAGAPMIVPWTPGDWLRLLLRAVWGRLWRGSRADS